MKAEISQRFAVAVQTDLFRELRHLRLYPRLHRAVPLLLLPRLFTSVYDAHQKANKHVKSPVLSLIANCKQDGVENAGRCFGCCSFRSVLSQLQRSKRKREVIINSVF